MQHSENIDLDGLKILLEDIERNLQAVNKERKKLIVLIGPARAGKSTTIAILRNKNIVTEEITIESHGRKPRKKTVFDVSCDKPDSGIGHGFIACTDTMRFFNIPSEFNSFNADEYSIVDTAGLFDTKGAISEIAHKTAFDFMLQCSEFIKPVILFNYEELSGTGSAVTNLVKIVSSIFNNDSAKLDQCLITCFTHTEDIALTKIEEKLFDLEDLLRSRKAENCAILIEKITNYIQKEDPRFQNIRNPCGYNGVNLWNVINSVKPLSSKEIKYNLEDTSRTIFQNSMERIKNELLDHIENKNFDIIVSTVTILSSLNEYIPDLVGDCLSFSMNQMVKFIVDEHKNAKQTIEYVLNSNCCRDNDFQTLDKFLSLVESTKKFRNLEIVVYDFSEVDKFENWVIESVENFTSKLQYNKSKSRSNKNNIDWEHNELLILDVLFNLSKLNIRQIKKIYDERRSKITKFLQNLDTNFGDINCFLDVEKINKLSQNFMCLQKSSIISKHLCDNFRPSEVTNFVKSKFLSVMEDSLKKFQTNLNDLQNETLNMEEIKIIYRACKQISSRYELFQCFGEENCKNSLQMLQQPLESALVDSLKRLEEFQNVENPLSNSNIKNFKNFMTICNELVHLTENANFTRDFTRRITLSKPYIQQIYSDIKRVIKRGKTDNISNNIIEASNSLKKLAKLRLFDEIIKSNKTFVSNKYEKSKNLIFEAIVNLIRNVEITLHQCSQQSNGKFIETMGHIKNLSDSFIFKQIGYPDNNVYETQKEKIIKNIQDFRRDILLLEDPKKLDHSLQQLEDYRNKLSEFVNDIHAIQILTATEEEIIAKIQNLIDEKLHVIQVNIVTKIEPNVITVIEKHVKETVKDDGDVIMTEQSEFNSPLLSKRKLTLQSSPSKKQKINHDNKSIENISNALDYLKLCNSCKTLHSKIPLFKQDYYEKGKNQVADILREIEFNFKNCIKNLEFQKANEYCDIFDCYRCLSHFENINDRYRKMSYKLQTDLNDKIREIRNKLNAKQFQQVRDLYEKVIEDEDKEKIISIIIDFLKENSRVKNDFYQMVLINIEENPTNTNIIEITPGNTDDILKEIKEIQNYKDYLNLDPKIDKELKELEAGIQRKIVAACKKTISDCESSYSQYFISVNNQIYNDLKLIIDMIRPYLPSTTWDEIVKKFTYLKKKYEKKLFKDITTSLKENRWAKFTKIWTAVNKTPKQTFGASDKILDRVKNSIEEFFDNKLKEYKDSTSIDELLNIIESVKEIKPDLPVLRKLNSKHRELKKILHNNESEFNHLLTNNNFVEASIKLNKSDEKLRKTLETATQQYFNEQLLEIESKLKNNAYTFTSCLSSAISCRDKMNINLDLNKFQEVENLLNLKLEQILKAIQDAILKTQIPTLTSEVACFIDLLNCVISCESTFKPCKENFMTKMEQFFTTLNNSFKESIKVKNIQQMKHNYERLMESQKLIELITSIQLSDKLQQLLLRENEIKKLIDEFLDKEIAFFNNTKELDTKKLNLLDDIPKILSCISEKTLLFEKFKTELIENIQGITWVQIFELWNAEKYEEVSDKLDFFSSHATVSNHFNLDVPNFTQKLVKIIKNDFAATNKEECASLFVKYRKIGETIQKLRKSILSEIESKANTFKDQEIFTLHSNLEKIGQKSKENARYVNIIIDECSTFITFKIQLFNKTMSTFSIDYALKKILQSSTGKNQDYNELGNNLRDELMQAYNTYNEKFLALLHKHCLSPKYDEIIDEVKELVNNKKKLKINLPTIVANIFAVWSLTGSRLDLIKNCSTDKDDLFKKPHPVQVVSIFMLISSKIENKLIQIKTGEGKSITLGVCSIIFALMGYETDVVCYSNILSKRDEEAFNEIFQLFKVDSKIHYNTIYNLCEKIISDNKTFDIRDSVKYFLQNNEIKKQNSNYKEQERVCLIDEVDVFCSNEFLGRSFSPGFSLKFPNFPEIVEAIWNGNTRLKTQLMGALSENEMLFSLIDSYTKMLEDSVGYVKSKKIDYFLDARNNIGFKIHDEICYSTINMLNPLFYFQLVEQGKISKTEAKKKIKLTIICGRFSYAEMPKKYKYLLGLTGTFGESAFIKQQLNIKNFIDMPSMHGELQLTFNKNNDFIVANDQDNQFRKIQSEIELAVKNKRAVLVFFENENKLNEFKNSAYCPASCNVIVESTEDKERLVRNATVSSTFTLLTKIFGRGTDFRVYDQDVQNNNGVLVIQTFFSDTESEEIQIQGRTARQGKKGQYMLILLKSDIKKQFNLIGDTDIQYAQLSTLRKTRTTETLEKLQNDIKKSLEAHENSLKLKKLLLNQPDDFITSTIKIFRKVDTQSEIWGVIKKFNRF